MRERLEKLPKDNLNAVGVDPYGYDPKSLLEVAPIALFLFNHYFRCEVFGLEHVPGTGRALLAGNHSGQIPIDGMMTGTAILKLHPQPRVVRGMVDRWVASLPFISTRYRRWGQVIGDPKICEGLLNRDEMVFVFPEGMPGVSKLFSERYQLKRFGTGFVRLAIKTQSPIIPFAVVGAEEQAPAMFKLKTLGKKLGLPALPIILPQLIPLPLPVKYRIFFGEPIAPPPLKYLDDKEATDEVVQQSRKVIQSMIAEGLSIRQGWFS